MAEKRVSVRLSATGGRQVRAELEGVGEAGTRGMGRLSRELDQANARMAAFARRARIASTAAATALAGAVVAMTRSTVAAANEIGQLSQVANANPEVFQRWSSASATVGIEQEKLADILKDVNDRVGDFLQTGGGPMADFFENIAPRVGVTADQFARLSGPEALQLYVDSLERAGVSQQEMTFYLEAMASDTTRLISLLQNGGAEMTRLGTRAQALGAVLDADAIAAMRRSELALVSIGQVFTGVRNRIAVALAPSLEAVANAFVALASSTSPISRTFDAVLSNLDRLAIYAGTFASFLAGRWVAAVAVAALSVRGLATTLVVLKGALIRTGIGALIVGAVLLSSSGVIGSQNINVSAFSDIGEGASLRTNVSEQCKASMIELHGQSAWDQAVSEQEAIDAAGGVANAERLSEEALVEARDRLPLADATQLYRAIGLELSQTMGGSSGVLLAIFFAAAGDASASGQNAVGSLQAGLDRIRQVGGASRGDRTMIDALEPALDALSDGLEAAAAAARSGADHTASITKAKAGRASYIAEASLKGHNDPGAEAVARLFEFMASDARVTS